MEYEVLVYKQGTRNWKLLGMKMCGERKEDLVDLVLRIKGEIWTKYDALDVMNLGIIKGIVLNLGRTRGKRKKPMSQMKGKNLKQRNLRKKKRKISIMIEIIFLFN